MGSPHERTLSHALTHPSPSSGVQALSYLDEDFLMQCEGRYLDKAHEVKVPIHLNMAACQIQLGDCNTAVYNCSEVGYNCSRLV